MPNEIACPQCGCPEVDYLRDPQSGEIIRPTKRRLVTCRLCKNIFPISLEQAQRLGGDEPEGTTIADERPCPHCGYILKTLHIGHRCPECGQTIDSVLSKTPSEHWRERNVLDWVIVPTAILCVLAWILRKHNPQLPWAAAFLMGVLSILKGIRGLRVGALNVGRGFLDNIVTGRRAAVFSIAYILLGFAIGIVVVLIRLGIIK